MTRVPMTMETAGEAGRRFAARRVAYGAAGLAGAVACALWLAQQVRFLRSGESGPPGELTLPEVGFMLAASVAVFSFDAVLLVAVAGSLVALYPGSRGPVPRLLLFAALLSATMSAVLYQLLVRPDANWVGLLVGFDVLAHYVAPVLLLLAWLSTGPRPRLGARLLGLVLLWPVAYLAYHFSLGALTGFHANPFLDPGRTGPVEFVLVVLALLAVAAAVGALLLVLDRRLPGRDHAGTAGTSRS